MSRIRSAIVLLAVLLFGCSHSANDKASSRSAYLKEVELTHQAGLPVYALDLKKTPPPPEKNAAEYYRALTPLVKSDPARAKEEKALSALYSRRIPIPSEVAAGRAVLARRKDILDLIHSAVSRPECDFQRDWSLGTEILFPEYNTMRAATRWLSAQSYLQLVDGKPLDAINTMALGFQVAKQASSDPILIAYLVGIALDAITLNGLEKVLYVAGEKPGVAEAVQNAIDKEWQPKSMAYAMGFEIVIQGITLETCRKGGRKSLSGFSTLLTPEQNKAVPELPSEADWQAFIDDSGTFMLQASRKIAAASDLPYPQASAKIREAVAPITDSFQKEMLIAAVLFPDFTQAATKRTGDEAHANVVRAAAKLLAWKRVHGSFPDKLEQAMPTVPADLFDLKPLRYRREGNGFVVYSVGQTGKFDGGTATVKPDAKESLFRYPRPAYLDQEAKPK